MLTCRICDGELSSLLEYKNMPAAQHFDNEPLRDLHIVQCSSCGLVQVAGTPVAYCGRAISTADKYQEESLKEFKDMYGLQNARVKNIVSYPLNKEEFDAFTIFNYLEHLPFPNEVLYDIHNQLSMEGIGRIEVPNFSMILKEGLFTEFTRDHLFYFTKDTLHAVITTNGFEVLGMKEKRDGYILSADVFKKNPISIEHFKHKERKLRKAIQDFLAAHRDVAIWGAGHQTLMLLSLFKLTPREIEYIVDSSKSKQGKHAPTGIKIVEPKFLKDIPVDGIIISAGSFNDAIRIQLKEMSLSYPHVVVSIEKGELVC